MVVPLHYRIRTILQEHPGTLCFAFLESCKKKTKEGEEFGLRGGILNYAYGKRNTRGSDENVTFLAFVEESLVLDLLEVVSTLRQQQVSFQKSAARKPEMVNCPGGSGYQPKHRLVP